MRKSCGTVIYQGDPPHATVIRQPVGYTAGTGLQAELVRSYT
jgi:hypothetical protein